MACKAGPGFARHGAKSDREITDTVPAGRVGDLGNVAAYGTEGHVGA